MVPGPGWGLLIYQEGDALITDIPKDYDPSNYDRPSVTVDVVIFSLVKEDLQVLLIKRKFPPFADMWAIPGGFVRMTESL